MKKHLFFIALAFSLLTSCLSENLSYRTKMDKPAIIPQPVHIEYKDGLFTMNKDTVVVMADSDIIAAAVQRLRESSGFPLREVSTADKNVLVFVKDSFGSKSSESGYYKLGVCKDKISIVASDDTGLFYGFQTLLQLTDASVYSKVTSESLEFYAVEIEDSPKYEWRGLHFDEGRHFMGLDAAKKFIDLMAVHKLNKFHWHLTEDQGWRIEIKSLPKLTEVGGFRKETLFGHYYSKPRRFLAQTHGGFYTQEQVKELIEYARLRCVEIVPEIEMPGHAQAAIAAYPELGIDPEEQLEVFTIWGVNPNIFSPRMETVDTMKQILQEVVDLFPSEYVHIGGDEAVKDNWKSSAEVQDIIAELDGVNDEHELQSWFIKQIAEFLEGQGKKMIGWDEIIEGGLAENAIVMNWRQSQFGQHALENGNDLIATLTSHTYLDYYQTLSKTVEPLAIGGFLPLEKVYSWDVFPVAENAEGYGKVLGGQGQLWSEYLPLPAAVEYMAFPRFCALAEVLWGTSNSKKYFDFENRLYAHLDRLDALKVDYRFPFREVKLGSVSIAGELEDNVEVEYGIKTESKRIQLYFVRSNGGAEFWINSVKVLSGTEVVAEIVREGFAGAFNRLNFYTIDIPSEYRGKELNVEVAGYMYTGGYMDLMLYARVR
ncbi:MAG: beta-N-acetylhexosaminidase [Spirochaetales bacterium]|nr:beta-N-acetylhexosaminidase [Spirochaetales bacterium]